MVFDYAYKHIVISTEATPKPCDGGRSGEIWPDPSTTLGMSMAKVAQHSFFASIDFIGKFGTYEKITPNELIDRGLWKTSAAAWTNPATHFIKSLIYKE